MWGFKLFVCTLVVVSVTSQPHNILGTKGLGQGQDCDSNEDHEAGGDVETPGLFPGATHAVNSRGEGEIYAAKQVYDPISKGKSFRAIISGGLEAIRAHYSTKAKAWGELSGTVIGNLGGFGELAEQFGGKKSNVAWSRCMKSFSNHGPETFDEAIVYLLGLTKVMGDIADAFFPGVGTAWVEGWYAAAVITTCNGPAREGAKFVSVSKAKWVKREDFVNQCQPEFAEQWGLRRFDGDCTDSAQVADFYGINGGASNSFLRLINKYNGGKGLKGCSGAHKLMFGNMLNFFKSTDKMSKNEFSESKQVDFFAGFLKSWASAMSAFAAPVPIIGPQIARGCYDFVNQFKFGGKRRRGVCGDKKKYLSKFSKFFGNGDFLGFSGLLGLSGKRGPGSKTGPGGITELGGQTDLSSKSLGSKTSGLKSPKIGTTKKRFDDGDTDTKNDGSDEVRGSTDSGYTDEDSDNEGSYRSRKTDSGYTEVGSDNEESSNASEVTYNGDSDVDFDEGGNYKYSSKYSYTYGDDNNNDSGNYDEDYDQNDK